MPGTTSARRRSTSSTARNARRRRSKRRGSCRGGALPFAERQRRAKAAKRAKVELRRQRQSYRALRKQVLSLMTREEVEALDEGYGTLILEVDGRSGPYTVGGAVELRNTMSWKRHRFVVRDWVLANRQANGADLRLVRPQGPLLVDRMWIFKRPAPRHPGPRRSPTGP